MWLSNVKLILVDRIIENGALRIVDDKIVEITESSGQPSGVTVFPGLDSGGPRHLVPQTQQKVCFWCVFEAHTRAVSVRNLSHSYFL